MRDQRQHVDRLLGGSSFALEVHPGSTRMRLRAKVALDNDSVEHMELCSLEGVLHFASC